MKKNMMILLFCLSAIALKAGGYDEEVGLKRYREFVDGASRKESRLMDKTDELKFLIKYEEICRAVSFIGDLENDNLLTQGEINGIRQFVQSCKCNSLTPKKFERLEQYIDFISCD